MSSSQKTRVSKLKIGEAMLTKIGKNIPANASATGLDLIVAKRNNPYSTGLTYSVSAPIVASGLRRDALVQKLQNKEYRDAYVRSTLTHGLAHQVRINREYRNLSQAALAQKCGKKTTQVAISRLEDPAYGKFTLNSILNIASALDVAVIVKLVPYSKFVLETGDKTVTGLFAKSFAEENLYAGQAMLTITAEINQQSSPYLSAIFPSAQSEERLFIRQSPQTDQGANYALIKAA
jgi:transcriptional regulator with XRE-family HTH domain